MLRFFLSAVRCRCAYIDLDGCLLERLVIPKSVPKEEALEYWKANLCPTRIIRHRLLLLYVLRSCGVRLIVWTNRAPYHDKVTRAALGRHAGLFSGWLYMEGNKHRVFRCGPCMDDDAKFIGKAFADLLVHSSKGEIL